MKYIEMTEEVGVPRNIEKAGETLYNEILSQFKKHKDDVIDDSSNFEVDFNANLVISEKPRKQLNITDINLNVDFKEISHDKLVLMSAGYNPRPEIDKNRWVLVNNNDPKELYVRLSFGYPDTDYHTTKFSDVIDYCVSNSTQLISSLTHELKHAYDFYVKPKESLKDFAHYMGITRANRFNINVINDFLHLLYLATQTELLVKPSEIYSEMTLGGINKEKFLEFILNNGTYKEFKKMREYTLDELTNGISDETSGINPKDVLRAVYVNMSQIELDEVSKFATDFFEDMMYQMGGVKSKGHEFTEKYYDEISKYENKPLEYFKKQVKYLNKVGDIMIRKIGKLYSIASEDTPNGDVIRKIYYKTNPQK
jgi:hypothetical protein